MLILEGCGQRQGGKALESQASESQRQELISYEIGDAEVTITRCDEATEGEVVIPDEIEGLPVTSIGGSAFSACGGLTSITIPDSVTSIGDGAFAGCLNLNSVTILDSVTSIGEGAFMVCPRLTSINIPDSVTSIGGGAFFDCSSLTSITVDSRNESYKSVDGVVFSKDGSQLLICPRGKSGGYTVPDTVASIVGTPLRIAKA